MAIRIDNLSNQISISDLILVFKWFQLLHQLSCTYNLEILIHEATTRLLLGTLDDVNFIDDVDVRHFHVDHSG